MVEVVDPPDVGTTVRLSQSFATLDLIPVLLDPGNVTLQTKDPLAAIANHAVTRDGLGLYHVEFSVPLVGQWRYRWESTGPVRAHEGSIVVRTNSYEIYAPPGIIPPVTPTPPASFYDFSSLAPTNPWVIVHNLDRYPSVTVTDLAGNYVIVDWSYIDVNTVIVTFSVPFAGYAHLE